MSEWISVKDRLPEHPGHYLVCTSVNYWHGGCLDVSEEYKHPISVLDSYYDITGNWKRVCNRHVTHWMPLPPPPEEATQENEGN